MSSWAAGDSLDWEEPLTAPCHHSTLLPGVNVASVLRDAGWTLGWLSQELQAGIWGRSPSGLHLH